jgi:hypothetical protein
MDSRNVGNGEVKKAIGLLKATEMPPTQVECIERALHQGTAEDVQKLLSLLGEQVANEQRFAKALLAWLAVSESAAERVSASLEQAAQQIEAELLGELLGESL